MRLFLQINIGEWEDRSYDNPWLSLASSLADDVIGTDVDNQSEMHVVELVKKLMAESEAIFLMVNSTASNQPLNHILTLINQLFDCQEKLHLAVLCGEHAAAEKLLRTLEERFVKNNEDDLIRKMIKQFARG